MSLTEYNISNTSNYYKHDGTRGIVVQKVLKKYIIYNIYNILILLTF